MPNHAGFAAAITIRERILDDALFVAYASGGFPHRLKIDALPGGSPSVSVDVFLDRPSLRVVGADASLRLRLRLWGQLGVTTNGPEEARKVAGELDMRIVPTFFVDGPVLVIDAPGENVTAIGWTFRVIADGAFPAEIDLYLRSDVFRERLQSLLRTALALQLIKFPKIDISFLGEVAVAASGLAQSRVLDGVLLIGMNIEAHDPPLIGDIDALEDFASTHDIAAVTHPLAVPITLAEVDLRIRAQVAAAGASIERLDIAAAAGRFRVAGKAASSTGSATFAFSVVPVLTHTRPGVLFQYLPKPLHVNPRTWPALGFSIVDVSVDTGASWWVRLIEGVSVLLTGAVGPLIVESILASIAAQFRNSIASANVGASVPRVRRTKPAKPGGARLRIEIARFVIARDGIDFALDVRVESPPAALLGPRSIPSDLRAQTVPYAVRLPNGIHDDDPELRVRWSVIDPNGGTVLAIDDGPALNRLRFALVPQLTAPGRDALIVGARVYRPLGAQVTDVLNETLALTIGPPTPPRAYARWRYDVKNPQVALDADETYRYTGELVVRRWSALHRTDRPCANANRRSRFVYEDETFDTLPFPLASILENRSRLCDYCFYGGPGKLLPRL